MTTSNTEDLIAGKFYWVVPVPSYEGGEEWEDELQPARYAGNGKWNYLNIEDESEWPVRYVGDIIPKPST